MSSWLLFGQRGAMLAGGLIGIVVGLAIGALIGAVILRAAIAWYNKMTGGGRQPYYPPHPSYGGYGPPGQVPGQPSTHAPGRAPAPNPSADVNPFMSPTTVGAGPSYQQSGVPEPDFGKAAGIALVAAIVNVVVQFAVGFMVGLAFMGPGMQAKQLELLATVIALPIVFLARALVLSGMIPTTFGKAVVIQLLEIVIVIAIGVVLGIIVFGVIAATRGV